MFLVYHYTVTIIEHIHENKLLWKTNELNLADAGAGLK